MSVLRVKFTGAELPVEELEALSLQGETARDPGVWPFTREGLGAHALAMFGDEWGVSYSLLLEGGGQVWLYEQDVVNFPPVALPESFPRPSFLPQLGEVTVLEVNGPYGEFGGPDSVTAYTAEEQWWHEQMGWVVEALLLANRLEEKTKLAASLMEHLYRLVGCLWKGAKTPDAVAKARRELMGMLGERFMRAEERYLSGR